MSEDDVQEQPPSPAAAHQSTNVAENYALARPVVLVLNRGRYLPQGMIYAGNLMDAGPNVSLPIQEMQDLSIAQALLSRTHLAVPEDLAPLRAALDRNGSGVIFAAVDAPDPSLPVQQSLSECIPDFNAAVRTKGVPPELVLHWSFAPWFGQKVPEGEPFTLYLEQIQPAHIHNMTNACLMTFAAVLSQVQLKVIWTNDKHHKQIHTVSAATYLSLLLLARSREEGAVTVNAGLEGLAASGEKEFIDFRWPANNGGEEHRPHSTQTAFARLVAVQIDKHGDELLKFAQHIKLTGVEAGEIIGASYHNMEISTVQERATQKLVGLVAEVLKHQYSSLSRYHQEEGRRRIIRSLLELASFACDAPLYSKLWKNQEIKRAGVNAGLILAGAAKFASGIKRGDVRMQKFLEYSIDAAIIISLGAAAGAMGPAAPVGLAVAAPVASGLLPLVTAFVSEKLLPARDWSAAVRDFREFMLDVAHSDDRLVPENIEDFKKGFDSVSRWMKA